MTRCLSAVLICTLFLISGCRTTRTLDLGSRSISSAEVQKLVLTHHAQIHSMKGEGRISVKTPKIAQSGSFILTLLKPDSVLINLQGPFGINVGAALVTRKEFLFYNTFENELITGSSNAENLNRILHVKLSFDELLNLFAGGTFIEDDLRSPDETCIEEDQFVLIYHSQNSSRRYWIDPMTFYINKIQFIDHIGKLTLEQSFSDFEDIDGFTMPHNIRITQPITKQMLNLKYSEMIVNAERLKFAFTIPQNAERINW